MATMTKKAKEALPVEEVGKPESIHVRIADLKAAHDDALRRRTGIIEEIANGREVDAHDIRARLESVDAEIHRLVPEIQEAQKRIDEEARRNAEGETDTDEVVNARIASLQADIKAARLEQADLKALAEHPDVSRRVGRMPTVLDSRLRDVSSRLQALEHTLARQQEAAGFRLCRMAVRDAETLKERLMEAVQGLSELNQAYADAVMEARRTRDLLFWTKDSIGGPMFTPDALEIPSAVEDLLARVKKARS